MYDTSHRGQSMATTLKYARGKGWLAQSNCCAAAARAQRERSDSFTPSRRQMLLERKRAHRALLEKHVAFMAAMQAKQLARRDADPNPEALIPSLPLLQDAAPSSGPTPVAAPALGPASDPAPVPVSDAATPAPARVWGIMDYLLPWRWLQ